MESAVTAPRGRTGSRRTTAPFLISQLFAAGSSTVATNSIRIQCENFPGKGEEDRVGRRVRERRNSPQSQPGHFELPIPVAELGSREVRRTGTGQTLATLGTDLGLTKYLA
ncbi:hypothetical protein HZH68_014673 [Vespula germanica]|uniref:Uncharacterized protein n=1 Tax=Vespula germanica TaxID=30212 RepID=A0A834J8I1_VESGE|nr:hypothetical protein HZH68_014673 [Vespula germanica]